MRPTLILVALLGLGGIENAGGIEPFTLFTATAAAFGLVNSLVSLTRFGYQQIKGDQGDRSQELMIDNIQEIGRDVDSIIGLIKDMDLAFEQLQWSIDFETLESLLRDMNSPYDRFLFYQRNVSAIQRDTLLEFARAVVSHEPHSPHSAMYRLRDIVIGLGYTPLRTRRQMGALLDTPGDGGSRQKRNVFRQGLFRQLESLLKSSRMTICKLDRSPKQVAYDLYSTVASVSAKTYAMAQFAYRLLRLFGETGGSYEAESELLRQSYTNISLAMALEVDAVMDRLSPVFWRCDPPQHERGATFEEVTELLQGILENEVDLDSRRSCSGTCSDFSFSNGAWRPCMRFPQQGFFSQRLILDPREVCERQRPCNGRLYDCHDTADYVTACLAQPGTHRRYNWIEYHHGSDSGVKGRKNDTSLSSCNGTYNEYSFVTIGFTCEQCFCLCDDHTHSERYFSLLLAVSDIEENRIVTGVRFVKLDGVFHIQLQQGEAGPLGYVNSSTVQWKPVGRRVDRETDKWGRDYVSLSYERRSLLLQDLRGSRDQVVTGVSFQWDEENRLSLKIRVTNISDVLAGRTPARSEWLRGDVPGNPPQLKLTSGPMPPTQSEEPSFPDSLSGQMVKFEASSLHLDLAQTTLPFLDVQDVAPRPAVALAGVDLFHKKGHKDSGGFIGLRVRVADLGLTEDQRGTLEDAARRGRPLIGAQTEDNTPGQETPVEDSQ